jgi:hypothetical protein
MLWGCRSLYNSPVNTNGAAARRTGPSYCFIFSKLSDADRFDITQILYHAHLVFGAVAVIQMFQSGTGKALTFKAIFGLAILECITIFYPASNAGNWFIKISHSAPVTPAFFS